MKTAAIIGATGHVGTALCRAFASAGWRVLALSRHAFVPTALRVRGVAFVPGWPEDSAAPSAGDFDPWLADADVIIDAAAPYPADPFRRSVGGERALVSAALRRQQRLLDEAARREARYGTIGSFVAHGPRYGPSTPAAAQAWSRAVRGLHPYFALKEACMHQVLAHTGRQPVVELDPTGFLGPYDRKESRLSLAHRLMTGAVPVSPVDIVDFVDVRDVASAMVRAMDRDVMGVAVPICGHSVPFARLIADLCAAGEVSAPRMRTLTALGWPAVVLGERILGRADLPAPIPSLALALVLECGPRTATDLQRALLPEVRPLAQTVADTVRWTLAPTGAASGPEGA